LPSVIGEPGGWLEAMALSSRASTGQYEREG